MSDIVQLLHFSMSPYRAKVFENGPIQAFILFIFGLF